MANTTTCSEVNKNRKSPAEINAFRPFVTQELSRRKIKYPTPVITPFVRLTSCLQSKDENYKYFVLGLHGYPGTGNLFNAIYGHFGELVGYAYRNGEPVLIEASQISPASFDNLYQQGLIDQAQAETANEQANLLAADQAISNIAAGGTHPIPGITKVRLERFAQGAGIRAVVDWQCYNRQQLEFLRHHFMTVGTYVVLEWGHQFSDRQPIQLIDFTEEGIEDKIAKAYVNGRDYIIEQFVCPNDGNYDVLAGVVSNFTVSLEAETNTYKCTTTIHTSGEFMWGLDIYGTVWEVDTPVEGRTTTIDEFFRYGGRFDDYINDEKNAGSGNVSIIVNQTTDKKAEESSEIEELDQSSNDLQYISWKAFSTDIIKGLMSQFENQENVIVSLESFFDFANDLIEDESKRIYIGNNPYLRSTDPEIMLIIRSGMRPRQSLTTNGLFDQAAGPDKGLLTQGVWLNAEMIRSAFLSSSTFEQAIRTILMRLNNASLGYWALMLYHDHDTQTYKIIDKNFGEKETLTKAGIPVYRFNVDTTGECLSIDFDSAFPPEVVTQLSIMARLKADPGNPQIAQLLKKYPAIAQSSHYALVMNWTDLDNGFISRAIAKEREAKQNPSKYDFTHTRVTSDTEEAVRGAGGDVDNVSGRVPPPNTESAVAEGDEIVRFQRVQTRNTPYLKLDRDIQALEERSKEIDYLINISAQDIITNSGGPYNIEFNAKALIKAVIAQESRFDKTLKYRREAHLDRLLTSGQVASYGYMHVLNITAYETRRGGTISEGQNRRLQRDDYFTMEKGTAYLIRALRQSNSLAEALTYYNSGVGHDWERFGPGRSAIYVSRVIGYYNKFVKIEELEELNAIQEEPLIEPPKKSVDAVTTPPKQPSDPLELSENEKERQADYIQRFGDSITELVEFNKSLMSSKIRGHGFGNLSFSNSFVAPFPITSKIEIKFLGIGGISIYDAFIVDKLPYLYERYGVFQTVKINEVIDRSGWTTTLGGVFRFMQYDAKATSIPTEPARE